MNRRKFLRKATALGLGAGASALLPRCATAQPAGGGCYRPGDKVDPEVSFLDAELNRLTLGNQVNEFTKVLYLFVFGGAYAVKPADKRGGLWCVDTVDDMAIHRTLYYNYAEKGVTFVPVATPPVYSGDRYGYPDGVFLNAADGSAAYQEAVEQFVTKTEALKEDGSLPFDPVFYDPRFRLLDNPREGEHVPAYGEVYPWQGRFKWYEDPQTYGTPTTWLLDRNLVVLTKPFYGNNYEAVPLHINYTIRDIVAVLDEALKEGQSVS